MKNFIKEGIALLLCLFCANVFAQMNYGEALQKSLFFYEAQQSGPLPSWNRVSWRSDSALNDGSDVGKDLVGGWYDAGDHVKFGFPMAYSVTTLAWGGIEYKDAYEKSGQMKILKQNLRFVTDYLIKCHTAPNEFYGQVGNGGLDHAFWGSPEVMVMDRPSYKIDTTNPGSDLAGETAAALAAASIIFKDSDPSYSATLLTHAKQLYNFADTYRGVYSESIKDAAGFYRSFSGYQDELVWGAAWLYRATNEASYLTKAETEYASLSTQGQSSDKSYKWGLAWDDKAYGAYVLMSQLTGKDEYKIDAERHLDFWTSGYNGEKVTYSPGGQAHLTQWGSLRHSSNTAFLAFVYSDKVAISAANKAKYHDFAVRQINYALGDNPLNRSFMVGFGNNPANNPHHRSGHGAWGNSVQSKPDLPSHTLFGALAGGPSSPNDQFEDNRADFIANEVATDYNSCFTGALARMYDEYGGNPLSNFPAKETPLREEVRSFSKFNSNNASGSTISIMTQNRTAWPSRVTDKLSYRYFFDISEGIDEGFTISDYNISLNGIQSGGTSEIKEWDASKGIYYMEVSLTGEQIAPIGDPQFRRETQINIRVGNGVPYDTSNDWSAKELNGSSGVESFNIPVYDNGVLVFGNEPGGGSGVNGGRIVGGPFTFTVGDGIADNVSGITLTGEAGDNATWVITDAQNNILGLPASPEDVNFDTAAPGTCLIWHLNYNGTIEGAVVGNNTSELVGDFDLSNSITVARKAVVTTDGGTITGGPFTFTIGDGIADNVSNITLADEIGDNSQWVITDAQNNILGLPANPEDVNFDTAAAGTCLIWHLSYNGTIGGASVGDNTSGITGDFDLSNSISVVRNPVIVIGDCNFGAPLTTSLPTINSSFENIYVLGNGGPNLDNIKTFTINWDLSNNGLYQFAVNTNNGTPKWYLDLRDSLTENFNASQPEATFAGTGIDGLDGAYWVTVDNSNFAMVSKSGEFTIYFSNTATAPDCNNDTVSNFSADRSGDCDFNTPLATALPNVNASYKNIYVLGNGGPNLDNVKTFTLNWDLNNNGLYQFAINTNNGTPDWYLDLKGNLTENFNASQPETTLTGTGITGLDGAYWVTLDEGNFVMVSKTGGFTIYFSNSSTAPECEGNVSAVDGGKVSTNTGVTSITTITGDGAADVIVFTNTTASTESYIYLITDESGNILTTENASHDFEGAAIGICKVYGLSYIGNLDVTGKNVSDTDLSDGEFSLSSNSIVVNRKDETDGCTDCTPADNKYIDRFVEIREEFYNPENGYFSADGSPHHSIETLIVEAPDHGHESTSELYSYWIWLEAMNGRITKDWKPLTDAWETMEKLIIPTKADQPTNAAYNPAKPASYASEFPLPENYPAPLNFSAPVGQDPISPDLTAAYGSDIYQMHWLLDNDNFYGFGNRGDGVSTPSYINTFQRGEQESVYETIPHPSWESFDWGGTNGFLPLFVEDQNYSKQWRYTSAPDADARAVQAMFWAQRYAKEQQSSINSDLLGKASKMGDFLRLSMFDKYFKPMGVQSATSGAGQGYDSAHYLMSWYMSWGGSADTASPWAFRISSSHCHFGYQNPVAAYAMTQMDELKPKSQNGERDWNESLKRQMEFYTWLQSEEGAIAGGATNSWNGDYSPYPAGKSTFYDMAYDDNPVYHDPGSGTWFGWQAWSMERVAEYYYITNDPMAKKLIDKWTTWVESEVKLIGSNDLMIPATLEWTGQPDTWNSSNPGSNSGLNVKVTDYGLDLGIAASMAKALIYYAAATEKYETLDTGARDLAKEVLDRMWTTYRDDKGLSSLEKRGDFKRMFEQEVHVPAGFSGKMASGDEIKPGVSFLDIRSQYKDDPEFARLEAAYNAGEDYTQNYHRSWAQIEIALANAEYGFFFGDDATTDKNSSIKSKSMLEEMSLVPNPVKDVFKLSSNVSLQHSRIRIVSLNGRLIKTDFVKEDQKEKSISLQGLESGIYVLEVLNTKTGATMKKKIVKE